MNANERMSSENQRNASTNRERKSNAPINVKPQGRGVASHLRELTLRAFPWVEILT